MNLLKISRVNLDWPEPASFSNRHLILRIDASSGSVLNNFSFSSKKRRQLTRPKVTSVIFSSLEIFFFYLRIKI
jgi:hypothetical protein